MAIETIGSMNNIIKNSEANKWVSRANFDELRPGEGIHHISSNDQVNSGGFAESLVTAISDVNKWQQEANKAIQQLASGKTQNIHETMLTVEKAEIAFKTMNQIRQKVLDAYKEVMRIQV